MEPDKPTMSETIGKEKLIITLEVSTEVESTASPWWIIIDPKQNFKTDTSKDNQPLHDIASMITGPFFSREEANDYLHEARHHFSSNAKVFCHSGCYSHQYNKAFREAWRVKMG